MRLIAFVLLFVASPASTAAANDPCSAASSVSDVQFALSLKDHGAIFQAGEIVPLALSFTSTTKKRYWADDRNYDRSGRLGIEAYCVDPAAADPLVSYFKVGGSIGGGLGSMRELSETPFPAEAELNEWRTLEPGHYRVYAISYRVWRPPDAGEQTPYGRVSEVVRSNAIEIDVSQPDPAWQDQQLRSAVQTLANPSSPEEARHAARRLRFLNTKDSTRELARLFEGLNQDQPTGWDLMFGLYGSPYRQIAIDAMHAELAVPERADTNEFLSALVHLRMAADASFDPPSTAGPEEARAFWQRRQTRERELTQSEMQAVAAALPRKTGRARALTLNGLLTGGDESVMQTIRPALIAAWADLPLATQQELIQSRWSLIAGPEMLPILRRVAAEPPPPPRTFAAMVRDAALRHIYELDAAAGREAILRDLKDTRAEPGLDVVKLLSKEDVATALQPAVERIVNRSARTLDYELIGRYAGESALPALQAAFKEPGKMGCTPQSAMLRYFLRVAPDYGAEQVAASLNDRKFTGCYKSLLQELGSELPKVQQIAIGALDDPDLEQNAALALGHWGTPDAEKALWRSLQRFHEEWADHSEQLRSTPEYQSPGSRGVSLEQGLVAAIVTGSNWICPPERLARLNYLVWTRNQHDQIAGWIKQWGQGSAQVNPIWYPEDNPTFSVLQYSGLTEDQLRVKLEQFPSGTQLRWLLWQPGQISPPVSMAKQEAVFERIRSAAAQHGVTLEKVTQP